MAEHGVPPLLISDSELYLFLEEPMAVKRIVANIAADQVEQAAAFYADVLGLHLVMDQGWIMTFAANAQSAPQISIASEGGSGTPCRTCRSKWTTLTRSISGSSLKG